MFLNSRPSFTPRVHNRAHFFVALPLIAAATLGFFTSVEAQAPFLPFNFQPNDNLNIRGYMGRAEHGANVWALSAEAKAPAQNDFQMASSFGWSGVGTHQVDASGDLNAQFRVSDMRARREQSRILCWRHMPEIPASLFCTTSSFCTHSPCSPRTVPISLSSLVSKHPPAHACLFLLPRVYRLLVGWLVSLLPFGGGRPPPLGTQSPHGR